MKKFDLFYKQLKEQPNGRGVMCRAYTFRTGKPHCDNKAHLCTECALESFEYLNKDIEESVIPIVNEFEYRILKRVPFGWKWIARDADRSEFCLYEEEPFIDIQLDPMNWSTKGKYQIVSIFDCFDFLQFEEGCAYRVKDLIKRYEEVHRR